MKERKLYLGKRYRHFKGKYYRAIGIADSKTDIDPSSKEWILYGQALDCENISIVYDVYFNNKTDEFALVRNGKTKKGKYVFYMALYDEGLYYIRDYDVFMSKTDRNKYPDKEKYPQDWRFQYDDVQPSTKLI